MAITYSIPIGPVVTLTASVVYALPGVRTLMYAEGSPTMAQSNSLDFAVNTPVTFTAGQAEPAGAFIRATADTKVRLVAD